MARTAIAVQEIGLNAGATVTWTNSDQANGMIFANDGRTVLLVKNGDASARVVTVASVADEAGRIGDQVPSVAAAATYCFGPLRPAWWSQRSTNQGCVLVDFAVGTPTTLQVAAVRLNF